MYKAYRTDRLFLYQKLLNRQFRDIINEKFWIKPNYFFSNSKKKNTTAAHSLSTPFA